VDGGRSSAPTRAGGTHELVNWPSAHGRWLSCSVGTTITDAIRQTVVKVPAPA
jgi:hypothetical protein